RDRQVDLPQPLGGPPDGRVERLDGDRARQFGTQQFAAPDPQPRQDRQGEHDDAHAAQPVGELTPEQHVGSQRLHVRQDGRAGGGEARHGLEVGVERVVELRHPPEDVGQRAEGGDQQPDGDDDEEALPDTQGGPPAGEPFEEQSRDRGGRSGGEERPRRPARAQRDGRGGGEGEGEPDQQGADDAQRGPHVHPGPRPGPRPPHRSRSRARTCSGSVRTITRSPGSNGSPPSGKTTSPSRTSAPTPAPGSVSTGRCANRLSGRTVMSSTSKRSSSSMASWRVRLSKVKRAIFSAVSSPGSMVTSTPAASNTSAAAGSSSTVRVMPTPWTLAS